MLQSLYVQLLKLHPAPFRTRFGDEMLDIFTTTAARRERVSLLADALVSLIRQWVFRPEFRQAAPAVARAIADVPIFLSMDPYKPRSAALFQGAFLTVLILGAVVGLIGERHASRPFPIGVHRPGPQLLSVDRSSIAANELNTTVTIGSAPNDPWHAIAATYFKQIRVLDALDADQDFTISAWEIVTAPAALRKLDKNHDGKLCPEECGFYVGAESGISPEILARMRRAFMRMNPVLAALDADHDGEISAAEIMNSSSALKKLDRNGDGRLTPDELLPDQESIQAAVIMMRLDKNGDGRISRAELESPEAEPLREVLQSADRNHDGLTTEEELTTELRLRAESRRLSENAQHAAGFR
jgi:Ca2+-binding EF-hand superfamily protein